jgi:excisionase family DNA binding protein
MSKVIPISPEAVPEKNGDEMIVTLRVADLRAIVRQEVKAALNGNSHSPALLSAEAAAKLFDVPKTWISEASRRGELPSVRLGHYVRFNLEDLEAFVKANRSA